MAPQVVRERSAVSAQLAIACSDEPHPSRISLGNDLAEIQSHVHLTQVQEEVKFEKTASNGASARICGVQGILLPFAGAKDHAVQQK